MSNGDLDLVPISQVVDMDRYGGQAWLRDQDPTAYPDREFDNVRDELEAAGSFDDIFEDEPENLGRFA